MTDSNVIPDGGVAEPSSSLLDRVRAHDQVAWERLVHLYSPLVFGWCRKGGLQPADAADVGQQVFLDVARAVRAFRREGGSFRAWLRAITRHRLCDHFRAAQTQGDRAEGGDALRRLEELVKEETTDPEEDREEEGLLFRRATELMRVEFEERTWRAFWIVVIDGLPAAEAAGRLGMTANAVYLARGRVLRRLREEFADFVDL